MTIIQIIFGVLFLIVKLILFRLVIQAYILKRIAVYFHLEWSIWLLCDFFKCKELVLWLDYHHDGVFSLHTCGHTYPFAQHLDG